jgi:hypothetical protein
MASNTVTLKTVLNEKTTSGKSPNQPVPVGVLFGNSKVPTVKAAAAQLTPSSGPKPRRFQVRLPIFNHPDMTAVVQAVDHVDALLQFAAAKGIVASDAGIEITEF